MRERGVLRRCPRFPVMRGADGLLGNICQRVTGVTHVTRFPTCIECQKKHYSVCQRTKSLHDSINYVFCHSQGMWKNASHASHASHPSQPNGHTQASHVACIAVIMVSKAQTGQAIPQALLAHGLLDAVVQRPILIGGKHISGF
jgi:hypothetical protein